MRGVGYDMLPCGSQKGTIEMISMEMEGRTGLGCTERSSIIAVSPKLRLGPGWGDVRAVWYGELWPVGPTGLTRSCGSDTHHGLPWEAE